MADQVTIKIRGDREMFLNDFQEPTATSPEAEEAAASDGISFSVDGEKLWKAVFQGGTM